MVKSITFLLAIAAVGLLASCSNHKSSSTTDTISADTVIMDSTLRDTAVVSQADSTRSFRNDRGTDSVAAGKNIPLKP